MARGEDALAITQPEGTPLLDVLRGSLGVRSATHGCVDGSCGSCRVLLNGALVKSCRVLWRDVPEGAKLETYEDLADHVDAMRAVAAFEHERRARCRLCIGALGVTAVALGREGRAARAAAVDDVLAEATCMCTGRGSLRRALMAT